MRWWPSGSRTSLRQFVAPFALVALVALGAIVVACGSNGDSARTLLRRAADADYPEVYGFRDLPDGAALLECAGAESAVVALIDRDRGVGGFGHDQEPFPELVWTPELIYVRSSAVLDAAPAEWIALDRGAPSPKLVSALGSAIGAYGLTPRLPERPAALARAAAATASSITVEREPDQALHVDATVPGDVLDVAAPEQPGGDLALTFFLADDDRISSIAVRSAAADAASESFGFTLTFDWQPRAADLTVPPDGQAVSASVLSGQEFRAETRPSTCEVQP